ncbi:hypothetical protein A0H81_14537 [Grifola frondosa]|uniref:Uncharacterized protein n=1 Tax=Grifola frondosa TaxID=5627 RepID=A0A1C7LMM1_GRIFR|nr:hypothetical protein A0H81_14537 [Grifola frondosa]
MRTVYELTIYSRRHPFVDEALDMDLVNTSHATLVNDRRSFRISFYPESTHPLALINSMLNITFPAYRDRA